MATCVQAGGDAPMGMAALVMPSESGPPAMPVVNASRGEP